MTFGEALKREFEAAREKNGGKLSGEQWVEVADRFYRSWQSAHRRPCHADSATGAVDPCFEALALGCSIDLSRATTDERRKVALALGSIRKATVDVTAQEIREACGRHAREYKWQITPHSVAGHWSRLFRRQAVKPTMQPPAEPPDWAARWVATRAGNWTAEDCPQAVVSRKADGTVDRWTWADLGSRGLWPEFVQQKAPAA